MKVEFLVLNKVVISVILRFRELLRRGDRKNVRGRIYRDRLLIAIFYCSCEFIVVVDV